MKLKEYILYKEVRRNVSEMWGRKKTLKLNREEYTEEIIRIKADTLRQKTFDFDSFRIYS